jgi:hypothetical protein
VTYNSGVPEQNATARQGWLSAIGISQPQYRVDFETGFHDRQNVSNVPGFFPGGLVVRDLSPANEAIIQQGPGSISLSNPVGQFALSHTPFSFGDLLLDFSASPVDYVAYQDIDTDSNNSIIHVTFLDGTTTNFFPDDTLAVGDSAEFLGFYRNDLPPITGVRLNLSGDAYGLDNLEYGVAPPSETSQWNVNGGGSWSSPGNWTGPVPNAAGAAAVFGTALVSPTNAPATITVDGDKTVGTLRFNNTVTNGVNPNGYNILAGPSGGDLYIRGSGSSPARIEVLAGTHAINAPLRLSTVSIDVADGSTLNITGNLWIDQNAQHAITKTGPGTVNAPRFLDLADHVLNVSQGTFNALGSVSRGETILVQPGATLLAGQIGPTTLIVRGTSDVERIANLGFFAPSSVTVDGPDAASPASLKSKGIRVDGLVIGHGKLTIEPSGINADTTVISSLHMPQTGSTLDLTNNDLILHAASGGPTYYATMRMLVRRARNSELGRWRGSGITSSAAAENPLTGLALVLNSRSVNGEPEPIFTNVSGEPTVLNDVIVKYAYNGDSNLDGRINADDYFRIDQGFLAQPPEPGYRDGDFNYDGIVNADDYFLIDQAFLGQGAPLLADNPLSPASAPEPCTLALLSALLGLGCRRRRSDP